MVNVVLIIVEHLLEQFDDRFAIGFSAVKGHRLFDLGVEFQLIRRTQINHLVVAFNGLFCLARFFVALRQNEQQPSVVLSFFHVFQPLFQFLNGRFYLPVL